MFVHLQFITIVYSLHPLTTEMARMANHIKTTFILIGFYSTYIPEWKDIYGCIMFMRCITVIIVSVT